MVLRCPCWMLWLLAVVFSFPGLEAAALLAQRPVLYTVRNWQTDDGLPQGSVFALAQTPDGYLWVGTREGLVRFDGVRFTPVEQENARWLTHAWITALRVGTNGSLWVGTDTNGLACLHGGVWSFYSRTNGLMSDQVRTLLESTDGGLWIGTEEGLARFADGRFASYTTRNGLSDNSVRGIGENRQRGLLVATRRGLGRLGEDGKFTSVTYEGGWNRNALRCVTEDRAGNLWVGSADGLLCLRSANPQRLSEEDGLPDRVITAIHEDSTGQLWVGTYGGLARIIDGKVVPWREKDSLVGDLVYTILEDHEGGLWVGARDGLYRLNPARFRTLTTLQGLRGNNVMSVREAAGGGMWVGVWGGGLHRVNGEAVTACGGVETSRDLLLALCEARDGTLWIGMDFPGGIQRFKDGVRTACTNAPATSPVRVIYEDRNRNLWVGTSGGLLRLKDGLWETYGLKHGLVSESVLAVCEDSQGGLWVGTEAGLVRRDGDRFAGQDAGQGMAHSAVTALYPDAAGALWVGTRGGGLMRLNEGRAFTFTTKHGLFSDDVYEILEDDFGYLWMSCRRGIFRVARAELEAVARGTRNAVTCTSFGKADGLVSVQCNGVAKPAAWKARDGQLWFPTIRGVLSVNSVIKANDRPPPVMVEEVRADNRPALLDHRPTAGGQVRLGPGRGELEIRYTALSFQTPEKNRFKYRLEGVDTDWVDAGTQRSARYNKVAPGTYRFRVIACNNDGVWNEQGAVLALVLLPHYWQTWWFKAALIGVCGVTLAAAYRVRMGRMRELERLRVEIAANLHDDVGARLTKVAMITELVDRQTAAGDRAKGDVRAIAVTTREIIQAMDEIVWTINPKNDTLDHLANYIFRYTQEYFQNTGVRCRLDLPAQLPELAISTEVRHNLFMTLKEALNNVLKHASASEVRVSVAVDPPAVSVTITDNGKGFHPASAQGVGEGLRNMNDRLSKLGGSLVVESRPGAGTVIRMRADAG